MTQWPILTEQRAFMTKSVCYDIASMPTYVLSCQCISTNE